TFGFFIMLLGVIWLSTPNMTDEAIAFGNDLTSHFQNLTGNVIIPAPQENHPVVYTAAIQFCFIFAAFEVIIFTLRVYYRDLVSKIADDAAGFTFWFSAGYFLYLLLNESTSWLGFIAGLIISGGLALIVSSIVKLFRWRQRL
ncbi:MAG: hypothetical protein AB1457_19265, partial [Chloroflexota bacterium]